MPTIRFKTTVIKIGSCVLLRLPESASKKFSSRGMVMAEGTINGFHFQAPLEPDGGGSHWLKVDAALQKGAHIAVDDTAELAIEPMKEWPEPTVPDDFKKALTTAPDAYAVWMDTTTMARWDWIRWINATKVAATRKKRIEVALSKLKAGSRRPCCFNRSMCTDPAVSNNGVLL